MATILAIETSCDETAVAIVKNRQVLSSIVSSQIVNRTEVVAPLFHLFILGYVFFVPYRNNFLYY